jgi:hypothetical protein
MKVPISSYQPPPIFGHFFHKIKNTLKDAINTPNYTHIITNDDICSRLH